MIAFNKKSVGKGSKLRCHLRKSRNISQLNRSSRDFMAKSIVIDRPREFSLGISF